MGIDKSLPHTRAQIFTMKYIPPTKSKGLDHSLSGYILQNGKGAEDRDGGSNRDEWRGEVKGEPYP